MKKVLVACALGLVPFVALAAPAQADEGMHLGQAAQQCVQGFGFSSVGSGIHSVVQDTGNFAGGVPMGLVTYCGR